MPGNQPLGAASILASPQTWCPSALHPGTGALPPGSQLVPSPPRLRPVHTPRPCSAAPSVSFGSTTSENPDWSLCSRACLPHLAAPPQTRRSPTELPSCADSRQAPFALRASVRNPPLALRDRDRQAQSPHFRGTRASPPALAVSSLPRTPMESRSRTCCPDRAHGAPTAPTGALGSCYLRRTPPWPCGL